MSVDTKVGLNPRDSVMTDERLFDIYRAICELREDVAYDQMKHGHTMSYLNEDFDLGYLDAASQLVRVLIGELEDYAPLKEYDESVSKRRLVSAIQTSRLVGCGRDKT